MQDTTSTFLSASECQILLQIARESLAAALLKKSFDLAAYPLTPLLQVRSGAFVTLRNGRELRGCIGYTRGIESLAEAVRDNVLNAALRDPRFSPITSAELPHIRIEISALCPGASPDSPFIPVSDVSEIVVGRDGLYVEHAGPRGGGLLLPQVAVDQGWNVEQFLAGVCRKAGASDDAWKDPDTRLYRFSAHVFSEGDE